MLYNLQISFIPSWYTIPAFLKKCILLLSHREIKTNHKFLGENCLKLKECNSVLFSLSVRL